MTRPPHRQATGFSLVEALVALLVLGVASVGLVRATEAHIDSVGAMEERAAAGWVADNRLAELQLVGAPALPAQVEMLGHRFRVEERWQPTADPNLRRVTIGVIPEGGARILSLDGFVDAGATAQ